MKTMIFSLVIVLMLVVMACSHAANLPPAVQQAAGTWPRCISGCTANDVEINSVWLDVPAGNYTLGETVTHNVSMDLYFHRQNTYCIVVVADLYEGGVLQQTDWVSNIIGYHDGSGNYTYSMGTVNWTYGTLFEMRNVLVEWSQNKPAGTCPTDCSNYVSSKCTQVATIIVTTPLIVDFEFNEVCFCNNTTFIDKTTGGEGSYTYDWDFGDSLGTSTEQNPIYHYASNGTYTVTLNVTDSDSPPNIDSQSYNVTVNEKPTATASSNSPVCEGATIELYGGPDSMASYSWTGPNGFNSGSQSPTIPNATTLNAGTYYLTVTDGGCTSDPASTVVVVNTKPTTNASSNSPICEGSTIVLTGGPGGMTSYSWTGPNGFSSSLQNPTIPNATTLNAGTYYLTVTDGGCTSDPANTVVVVNTKPTASASSNSPICEGSTIVLTGGPGGMTSYSWTGPNGFSSGSQNPTIPNATTLNAGTYYLTVTDGGCTSDPASTVVVVNTKPTATASSNSPVCEGATIELYGGPDSMASYSWTGPNGFNSSSQSPTIPNATTSNAGAYYLTVTDGGCTSDPANTTVVVGTKPTASASSNSPVSEGATIQLYGGPDGMTSYSWTGPGGWTSSLQNPTRTGATTTMAGTYTLTVTNSNGCTDDESTSVIVNTKPTTKASSNPPVCCRSLMISSTEGGSITTAGEGESSYVDGTVVDLVASPNPGYKFVNWTGNVGTIANVNTASTTITMVGCYSITANFALIPTYAYEVTMAADPEAGGTATDLTNESPYAEAAEVNIIAEANEGYRFVNWTAPAGVFGNATAVETIFTMPAEAVTVTANFEEVSLPSGVPTVTTQAATGISSYAGFVNMSYTVGNFSPVQVRFACKRSTDPAWFYTTWVSRTADGTYTEVLTGLISQTEYEFKAQLKYNGTVIDGNTLQFTTATQPSGGCFIATAAYGTPTAEQLDVLREFRDIVLLESTTGSQFVALYYQLSPPVADFISGNEFLRTLVRELLADPIVWIVEATGDIWRN